MSKPFHLSFVVPDKEACKRFYLDVLDCTIGRDNEAWCDVILHGHQLTIHQATEELNAFSIDHFGPVLDKKDWESIIARCKEYSIGFVVEPMIKNKSMADESGKFLLTDPGGNTLEFKYYLDFGKTVIS